MFYKVYNINIMKLINKIVSHSFLSTLIVSFLFVTSLAYFGTSPVIAQVYSASDTVVITLNVVAGISISSPSDVTMSQSLGVSANTAVASTTWTVITNNVTGYNLTVKATSSPAMANATSSVSDYQTSSPNTWSVSNGTSKFGFSAYGTDVNTSDWGSAGAGLCQSTSTAHVPSASLKYLGFTTSTSSPVVATRASVTPTSGNATTLCYAVEQNGIFIDSGVYTATVIATAVTI